MNSPATGHRMLAGVREDAKGLSLGVWVRDHRPRPAAAAA
jgi:hypothetical protein